MSQAAARRSPREGSTPAATGTPSRAGPRAAITSARRSTLLRGEADREVDQRGRAGRAGRAAAVGGGGLEAMPSTLGRPSVPGQGRVGRVTGRPWARADGFRGRGTGHADPAGWDRSIRTRGAGGGGEADGDRHASARGWVRLRLGTGRPGRGRSGRGRSGRRGRCRARRPRPRCGVPALGAAAERSQQPGHLRGVDHRHGVGHRCTPSVEVDSSILPPVTTVTSDTASSSDSRPAGMTHARARPAPRPCDPAGRARRPAPCGLPDRRDRPRTIPA